MKSLGLDLSTAATGLVLLESTGTPTPKLLEERELKHKTLVGMERVLAICSEIMLFVHDKATKPDVIVLEGYSLNTKNASSIVPLVELGGVLRFLMHLDGLKWYDPRASVLKKFVTGKGTAEKDKMMMCVLKRWGHESMSNNTADAYGLACMGLVTANKLPGITLDMRAIAMAMNLVGL